MSDADRPPSPHRFRVEVGAHDLDDMGHVNNARYLDYFERARMDWYAEVGLFEAAIEESGAARVGTAVVNVNVDFIAECLLGEALSVTTLPRRIGRKSFSVTQRLLKASGDVAAEAVVTSVVMDLDARNAVALPSCFHRVFAADPVDITR